MDRLVLLGDLLELRHGPAFEALDAAEGFLREVGTAMAGREVVLVPGNHDHELIAPWLERRRRDGWPPPLGLSEAVQAEAGDALGRVLAALAPAEVRVRYPGLWVRDDVWAAHGHQLDLHVTVPTFERLAAGLMRRIVGSVPERGADPDDYERVLAPIYAWVHAVAQDHPPEGGVDPRQRVTQRVWRRLTAASGHAPVRARLLRAGFGVTVGALDRAGLGPLRADVSAAELRRAGLLAMGEVARRLGVGAAHVVFGHTHRAGPRPRDDPAEWRAPGGAELWNTGTWVHEEAFAGPRPGESPYWPGAGVEVGPEGPPRPVRITLPLG